MLYEIGDRPLAFSKDVEPLSMRWITSFTSSMHHGQISPVCTHDAMDHIGTQLRFTKIWSVQAHMNTVHVCDHILTKLLFHRPPIVIVLLIL